MTSFADIDEEKHISKIKTGDYLEPQESLGCGRHAINNLFGQQLFVKNNDQVITRDNFKTVSQPIGLQNICRFTHSLGLVVDQTVDSYCPNDERYDVTTLKIALNAIGYELSDPIPRDANEQTIQDNDNDNDGFLININNGYHWVALRKVSDKQSQYILIDSVRLYGKHTDNFTKLNRAIVDELTKKPQPIGIFFKNPQYILYKVKFTGNYALYDNLLNFSDGIARGIQEELAKINNGEKVEKEEEKEEDTSTTDIEKIIKIQYERLQNEYNEAFEYACLLYDANDKDESIQEVYRLYDKLMEFLNISKDENEKNKKNILDTIIAKRTENKTNNLNQTDEEKEGEISKKNNLASEINTLKIDEARNKLDKALQERANISDLLNFIQEFTNENSIPDQYKIIEKQAQPDIEKNKKNIKELEEEFDKLKKEEEKEEKKEEEKEENKEEKGTGTGLDFLAAAVGSVASGPTLGSVLASGPTEEQKEKEILKSISETTKKSAEEQKKEEEARKAQEEEEANKQKEEEERKAKEEERKAKEEERKAKEAERKAQEEEALKAEAERNAKAEAERKAKEPKGLTQDQFNMLNDPKNKYQTDAFSLEQRKKLTVDENTNLIKLVDNVKEKKDRVNKIKDQIKQNNNQIVDNNKDINKKRQRLDEIKKEIATTEKIKEKKTKKNFIVGKNVTPEEDAKIIKLKEEATKINNEIKSLANTNTEVYKQIVALKTELKTAEKEESDATSALSLFIRNHTQYIDTLNNIFNTQLNTRVSSLIDSVKGRFNFYVILVYICLIIILSVLLAYRAIEYNIFLLIMCPLLISPIIGLLLTRIQEPKTKYLIIFTIVMVFLVIMTLMLLFNNGQLPSATMPGQLSKGQNTTNSIIVFSIIAFFLLLAGICWFLLKTTEFKELFVNLYQISNVLYVIFYIIFLIILLFVTSKELLNTYAYIITPLLILLGMVSFMYSFKQTPLFSKSAINPSFERLKYFILLVCLITIITIFYKVDLGGYMTTYFGQTFSLAIAMMVFGFLFLLFSINLSGNATKSIVNSDNKLVVYNILLFVIFLIVIVAGIVYFPGGFQNNPMFILIILLLLIIFIGWIVFFGSNLFSETLSGAPVSNSKTDTMKRILIMIFGLIFISLLLVWLIATFQDFTSKSTIGSGILNIIILIFALSLIYKIITIGTASSDNKPPSTFKKGVNLILSIIFYIPCLITSPFELFSSSTSKTPGDSKSKTPTKTVYEYTATIKNAFLLFVIIVILWVLSLILPFIEKRFNLQGGKQLVSTPIPTNTEMVFASYEKLNGDNHSHYQYAISFWVYIDALGPNTNSNYNKFTSLLNYGGKPNILYNGNINTLMITMKGNESAFNKLTDLDEDNNRILYKQKNVLLQKWNNITLNYTGGTFDIFINGKLMKSNIEVIPYITLDNLTVGTNNGVEGAICNLAYFRKPLTITNIYYLYETLKNKTPPFIETLRI